MIFRFLILVAVIAGECTGNKQLPGPPHNVRGSIIDTHMAGVKDAELEFTNGQSKLSIRTASDGTFYKPLATGHYFISVVAEGSCPYFGEITLSSDLQLNLILLDCSDCPEMSIDFVEPRVEAGQPPPDPPDPHSFAFRYKQESLGDGGAAEFRPSVRYGREKVSADNIEFTGLDCPGHEKLPTLVYKGGSLRAMRLMLSKQTHTLRGEGNVTVADERGVSRGSSVEINLALENPVAVVVK